jgi:hypothetical protein
MKVIKYDLFQGRDAEDNAILLPVAVGYSESNLAMAEQEAYGGEYTIVEDSSFDEVEAPSQLDAIEAQVAYTAMMTNTLLEV